ncbi:MAG: nickel-dependent lactate racemase [Nitrososphaeria archaeon]
MEKVELKIPYSESFKIFKIFQENLLAYIQHPLLKHLEPNEEDNEIERALANPIGCERLSKICDSSSKAIILVDDWTRPTPAYKVIKFVLKEIKEAGVRDENISFIVARGTHRKPTKIELQYKLGKDTFKKYSVSVHDCDRNLAYLGKTSRGTPIWVNRNLLEADVKISIGTVIPHPLAGYGGGAKIILPGVSGRETINYNHSLVDDPRVKVGAVDGNPIREDMEEVAGKVGLNFSINLILDERKNIVKVFCGNFVRAHRECVREYEKIYGVKVSEQADILVLGSCPRDATFGHATFSLYSAIPLVKEGGTIVFVTPCTDGPGTRFERLAFRELAYIEPEDLIKQIREGVVEASAGAFDYCYSKVLKRNRIILVSDNYSREEAVELGLNYASSIEEALNDAFNFHGEDARVTVAPLGGMMIVLDDRV